MNTKAKISKALKNRLNSISDMLDLLETEYYRDVFWMIWLGTVSLTVIVFLLCSLFTPPKVLTEEECIPAYWTLKSYYAWEYNVEPEAFMLEKNGHEPDRRYAYSGKYYDQEGKMHVFYISSPYEQEIVDAQIRHMGENSPHPILLFAFALTIAVLGLIVLTLVALTVFKAYLFFAGD